MSQLCSIHQDFPVLPHTPGALKLCALIFNTLEFATSNPDSPTKKWINNNYTLWKYTTGGHTSNVCLMVINAKYFFSDQTWQWLLKLLCYLLLTPNTYIGSHPHTSTPQHDNSYNMMQHLLDKRTPSQYTGSRNRAPLEWVLEQVHEHKTNCKALLLLYCW